ncbi:MAG TPA: glycosyltransferase [Polyangia bacterium]|jgi:ceramide glucosyltransferase|nr:glycosyltransferase [Polyangia bacterium]
MAALRETLSLVLLVAAAIGAGIVCLQAWVLRRHLRATPVTPAPRQRRAISILKPLCGLDDQLADNLASFAALPYPHYEVILGVASADDPAYPIAAQTLRRWPERFRLVIQRGAPGFNPKVNQLIGLGAAARADILVISDSNTRVPACYLDEIAAHLADPGVGLVTHPLAGESPTGSPSCGARLDNLHLTTTITPGFVAASSLCGKTYVVGKSMAMRRADLDALGGFQAVKDVLAEDFVLGRLVPARLGKRVVLGRAVVACITERRSPTAFAARYARWSVMQRQCSGLPAYLGLLLLNPVLLALLALAVAPAPRALAALTLVFGMRALADSVAGRLALGRALSPLSLALIPFKELLTGAAWAHGLVSNTIVWRSHRLRVGRGSALSLALPARRRARRPPLPVLPPLGTAGPRASAR